MGALAHPQEVHSMAVKQLACVASVDVYGRTVDAGIRKEMGGRVPDLDVFLEHRNAVCVEVEVDAAVVEAQLFHWEQRDDVVLVADPDVGRLVQAGVEVVVVVAGVPGLVDPLGEQLVADLGAAEGDDGDGPVGGKEKQLVGDDRGDGAAQGVARDD